MRHILIVIYLCCFNAATVAITKRKFGQCIPVSLMLMPLIMYFVQFACGSFGPAYIIMLAIAAIGVLLAILQRRTFKENYFTLGLLAFLVACAVIIVLDYRNFFTLWDEQSHWGIMTKEMLRLDTWYSVPESRLDAHPDYPPYMQLFETLWCYYAGGFSEMGCNYALHIFSAGLFVPVIAENEAVYLSRKQTDGSSIDTFFRNLAMMLLLVAFYLFLGNAFDGGITFTTIYKDIVTALMFTYAMLLILHKDALRDPFGYFSLILVSVAILLTKQMGMCYALIVWFYYLVMYWVENRKLAGNGKAISGGLLRMIPLVAIPYGINCTWTRYVRALGWTGQFDLGKISVSQIVAMANDTYAETPQRKTLSLYAHALYETDLFGIPIPISYVAAFLIVLALLYAAYRMNAEVLSREEMLGVMSAFTCGTFGYALTMGILYLFCFSEVEMLALASYNRYMAPYVYAEFLIIAVIYLEIWGRGHKVLVRNAVYVFVICILLLGTDNLSVFVPSALGGEPFHNYQSIAAMLDEQIGGEANVYCLTYENMSAQLHIRYYVNDVYVPYGFVNVLEEDLSDDEVREEATTQIFENDYLYVMDVNDQFNEYYAQYNGGNNYVEGALYRIDHDGDSISVTMVSDAQ